MNQRGRNKWCTEFSWKQVKLKMHSFRHPCYQRSIANFGMEAGKMIQTVFFYKVLEKKSSCQGKIAKTHYVSKLTTTFVYAFAHMYCKSSGYKRIHKHRSKKKRIIMKSTKRSISGVHFQKCFLVINLCLVVQHSNSMGSRVVHFFLGKSKQTKSTCKLFDIKLH